MVRLRVALDADRSLPLRVVGPSFHYLVRVHRLGVGDALEVFDGEGTCYAATLVRVDEGAAFLTLGEARRSVALRPLTMLLGLPKADKLEWVLQKGTELGATGFAPVACARSVTRLTPERAADKLSRWEKIVAEAARQCGRSDVPRVELPRPLVEAAAQLPPGTGLLVLDEEERVRSLGEAYAQLESTAPLAVVVGPEGGLTREEVSRLVSVGGQPVTLGRRVLRAETAALAALAVARHLDGELG